MIHQFTPFLGVLGKKAMGKTFAENSRKKNPLCIKTAARNLALPKTHLQPFAGKVPARKPFAGKAFNSGTACRECMKIEFTRQLIHAGAGIAFAFLALHANRNALLLLLGAGFLLGLQLSFWARKGLLKKTFLQKILATVSRKDETGFPGKGALLFLMGCIFALYLFPNPKIAAAALLALGAGDGASTLAGKRFGSIRLVQGKTLEGSLAGIAAATLALSFLFSLQTAFIAACFGMLAEYLPLNDNITIPLATGFALLLLV